jgi:hypothetical protein
MATPALDERPTRACERLTDGQRLERAGRRLEWAARSLHAAAEDLDQAAEARLTRGASELAEAVDRVAHDTAARRRQVPHL